MEKNLRYVIASMVLLAPASTLVVRGGTGYCFFVLLAIALFAGFSRAFRLKGSLLVRAYPWYTVAMLGFMVYLPLQQATDGYFLPREFDGMSRFTLSLPIFLLLVNLPIRHLKAFGWGCALGAIGAGAWAVDSSIHMTVNDINRLGNTFTNPIPYGNTALLLGFLSAMTIRWDDYPNALVRRLGIAVKLLGLAGGVYASYLSGTRGGWLAIPLFLALCSLNFGWVKHAKHWLVALLVVALAMAALFASPLGRERVLATQSDVTQLAEGSTAYSSIGARLLLWRASIHLFEAHPLTGVGKGHLESSLRDLAKQGEVPAYIVNQRAHSEFFSTIAELGALGVVCLGLLYAGPLLYFVRYRRSPHRDVSTAAYCGMAVSGSVIIFGLSIDVFTVVMSTALIALIWAVLLAVITHDTREPRGKPGRGPIG
ncbi:MULTISPECIES: O-antigen ligase family protein [unclassified Caballeronia]|uniref:O-antigen ligase family protein n=1 Tax=unclassified Caballeronia TaxID=2646786 RepID=UPI0028641137|nr:MULTISPECIES: O-antigen ligase family protein [unclassified Caballeronia]MDR5812864.1 O-antigen ligase family protein [Caballeronia sp. LZ033]MDR5819716.1 O-antigen ligase family protein [Caballeronia sp. LZ043]MDR5877485.1 O-antigen ligase family protein [Caballeronia sp. LZ032]